MRATCRSIAGVAFLAAMLLIAPVVGASPAPDAVTVWDTSGPKAEPCPPIDFSDPRDPKGGCPTDMFSGDIDIVIRSLVGDMLFGRCSYEHDMIVDGGGHTFLENIAPGGPNPCNDMGACDHEDVRPWEGRIQTASGGRMTHVIQACFDTCMGQFVGELRLRMERVDGSWRQTADRALIGDSGYQIDGSWRMGERGIDIRPEESASGRVAGLWGLTSEPVGWPI
jgi:hypothetical protein